jgi:hypothetical protein
LIAVVSWVFVWRWLMNPYVESFLVLHYLSVSLHV